MEGHRKVTDTSKEESKHSEQQRPMGVPYTLEEIEKLPGELDEDNFYHTTDGNTYFDPWGYRFDKAEDEYFYDEFGGFYDEYGYYIPGDEFKEEYDRNYADEEDQEIEAYLKGLDEEEEEEEKKRSE